ncbi:Do family serine endopeptidase [Luminiphilus sp.]|jgi:serine protease Do|nr:Do family serine endopeptidase [bacterium]MDB2380350.1 Do family serine endopeptidase [Luminiphilus sp.]MDB2434787.1 Do family serine endopeptidase [Luminiphilus sp.]MDB2585816.1 Do family serine endopeptidase [Luminiphilus sp.]MDB2653974.1 Do family serine endopeptidase [Luminiphilus sp.]
MIIRVTLGLILLAASQIASASLPDFATIVEETSPAVVKIIAQAKAPSPAAREQLEELEQLPDALRRFFQDREPQAPRGGGTGSGFIISKEGYIVTNHHVVAQADEVIVRLSDRREFDATVIGTDQRSDLALLQVDANDLPFLQLGKSSELKVGEWVLAIGSPFGLDYSVTAGIVSAKGRSLPTERGENYVPFIQTDVAINPGNSGGPLFNLQGEVVGVNSQIFTRSGGSIGLSFAIPAKVVKNIIEQLEVNGEVVRGWLGVSIQNVDRTLAESFDLDRPRGALVAQVGKDSPAERAGIESGDIIVEVDGEQIEVSADLPHVIGLIAPGSKVPVSVIREGKERSVRVEIGALEANEVARVVASASEPGTLQALGMVVRELQETDENPSDLRGGVLVTKVDDESAADESGVRAGDILTRFGRTPISRLADMESAIEQIKPGDSVSLRLIRQGSPQFIGIKVPEND